MAQKDIQDIANYMKQLEESRRIEEQAYAEAQEECDSIQELEDVELEDEVIDKRALGFIDDTDLQDESDELYPEDEDGEDAFNEDVSDCLQTEDADPEQTASIKVEVYNEDGFGKHFAQEVNRNIPGVKAVALKTLPNGDILVKMSGDAKDLEDAYAFYVGKEDYSMLNQDDKEDFESRLVYDDGDTVAEAQYREDVAHLLDPVGVNASTANLVAKDTCQWSMIKEEKCNRKAAKIAKALMENDFSSLSDDDLDTLDSIKDAIDSEKSLNAEQDRVWTKILAQMGYTKDEWEKLTPEQRDKVWAASEESPINPSGFARWQTGVDQQTGKKFRYQNKWLVKDPETGKYVETQFNPDYTSDKSPHQHPSAAQRQMDKDNAAIEQGDKEKHARQAMAKARGKDTWDINDFGQMIAALDDKQRKELMNSLIADVDKDNPDNPRKAGEEAMFIKKLFGKKLTLRDFAKAWGKSAPGVMKFADETQAIWRKTLKDMGITTIAQFKNMPQAKFDQFLKLLKINMEGRRSGSIVAGR